MEKENSKLHQGSPEQDSAKLNQKVSSNNNTVQFLLTEFSQLAEDWRHTDSRIETVITIYLTFGAVALPSLSLLYQALHNVRLFILGSMPVAFVLFSFGYFLTRRITFTDFSKARYRQRMQMIRNYFIDHDTEFADYIDMSGTFLKDSYHVATSQNQPYFHRSLVRAINSFTGFIVGVCTASIIWLLFGKILSPIIIGFISIGICIGSYLILSWLYMRRIRKIRR